MLALSSPGVVQASIELEPSETSRIACGYLSGGHANDAAPRALPKFLSEVLGLSAGRIDDLREAGSSDATDVASRLGGARHWSTRRRTG